VTYPSPSSTVHRCTQVDKLIVIAGPSCSGKSTFIRQLQRGKWPHVEKKLGIENIADWRVGTSVETSIEKLILHYELTSFIDNTTQPWNRPAYLSLLESAADLKIVHVWTEPDILVRRHNAVIQMARMAEAVVDRKPLRLAKMVMADGIGGTLRAQASYGIRFLWSRRFQLKLHRTKEVMASLRLKDALYRDGQALRDLCHEWIWFCVQLKPSAHYVWRNEGNTFSLIDISTFLDSCGILRADRACLLD